jgi:hypothetical protein
MAAVVLAIRELAWSAAVLVAVLLLLRHPVARAPVWNLFLMLIGVSKTERRKLGVAAAKHDLGIRDPP